MNLRNYPKDNIFLSITITLILLSCFSIRLHANYKYSNDTVATRLNQVDVWGESISNKLKDRRISYERLTAKDLRTLPSLMGDPDLVKILQLKSGVKSLGDGAIGMFVRGGGSDQNQLLIDNAPIYNIAHLCGMVSSFNTDVLENVNFYKGGIPADYGGRVSGVVDVQTKSGIVDKPEFSIGLSSLYANIYGSVPIKDNSSSIVFAARTSLPEYFGADKSELLGLLPTFFDANLKINRILNATNSISWSLFRSDDKITESGNTTQYWSNSVSSINWKSFYSDDTYSILTAIYSRYDKRNSFGQNDSSEWRTGITDLGIKYKLKKHNHLLGVDIINHSFTPGESNDIETSLPTVNGVESALYAVESYEINRKLSIDIGLRLSLFKTSRWFMGVEPRVMGRYLYSDNSSLKFSYTRGKQYMQVLNDNSLSYTSNETWFPANENIEPIVADQLSLGWFSKLNDNTILSVQAYSKWYQNQIDYIDNAVLTFNPNVEDQIVSGTAHSYGVEFNLEKIIGRFIGTLGYSYSRAFRRIESIENGKSYSAPYDIPHDLKLNASYRLSGKWRANGAWVYTTGRPTTMPKGFYNNNWIDGYRVIVPIYSERNAYRMPDYHRLDIGVNYTNKTNTERKYWDISMGISNVYNRSNPIGYDFRYYGGDGSIAVFQYSFLSIFPSLSIKYHL